MYDLTPQIINRLKTHYQFKERGEHLREGVCPDCDKKSLWTWKAKPGMIQCNRISKCGFTDTGKNLFPDLFEHLEKQYPKTQENPNATADAYLALVRGFDLDTIRGSYTQHSYWHPNGDRGSPSIRFDLKVDKTVYWERLIDDVTLTHEDGTKEVRNKSFKGAFKGLWWKNPAQKIDIDDTIYLTEGIFDAIALNMAGLKACSMMSSGSLPKDTLKQHFNKNITWVLALDNETGARRYTRKHVRWLKDQGEKASAMFSSDGTGKNDWNDLHQAAKLTEDDIKRYRHYGKLELVDRAIDKAQLLFEFGNKKARFFTFSHYNALYRCVVDEKEYVKIQDEEVYVGKDDAEISSDCFYRTSNLTREANCNIRLLHILESELGDDPLIGFGIDFSNGSHSKIVHLTGGSLSAAGDFKKSIMNKAAGTQITISQKSLDSRVMDWFYKKPISIKQLDYVGYNKEHGAYIFDDYAVQNGNIIPINKDDFFELKNGGVRSSVDAKQKLSDAAPIEWFDDFKIAYGEKGMVALAWWIGSLFAEQIRQDYSNYPFIEIIGEAASGKSRLVAFLWKLLGKEADSFNPNSSTMAGRMRKMAQFSNLPTVFNETDNETNEGSHAKKFNWDEQKDLYEGELARHTGTKSIDNRTRNPQFRSTLCAVQNIPIFASPAIMSRLIHLQLDSDHHSEAGRHASDRLNALAHTDVSGFLLHTVVKEKAFLKHFKERLVFHIAALQHNKALTMQRIIENHAYLLAIADCLPLIMSVKQADIGTMHRLTIKMAETRQTVLKTDNPRVELFWENFNYLNARYDATRDQLNLINHHSEPDDYIYVNLREVFQLSKEKGLDLISTAEMIKILPTSVTYEFEHASKVVKSSITGKSTRCFKFKTPERTKRDIRDAAERKGKR